MKMSFSISVWKYALLTLNVVMSILGVIVISVGVITLGGAGTPVGAYMVTLLGVLILTLCSLGCFASLRESYILSMSYVGLGAFTAVCETIFMITYAVLKENLMEMTKARVADSWELELTQPGAMYDIQVQYECCGKDSPQDYLQDNDDVLPLSCCRYLDCSDDDNIYAKGCDIMAVNFVDSKSDNLMLTLVGLVALEALGIMSAYYLGKTVQARGQKSEQIIINE